MDGGHSCLLENSPGAGLQHGDGSRVDAVSQCIRVEGQRRREIPRLRRPATSQERSRRKKLVCSARNDSRLGVDGVSAEGDEPRGQRPLGVQGVKGGGLWEEKKGT